MRYFANFKNGKIECNWERENGKDHPSFINKEDVVEITEEQYKLKRFLTLNKGSVVLNSKYVAHVDLLKKKEDIKNKITDKELSIKDKLDAIINYLGLGE